jgi:hypothetical protein
MPANLPPDYFKAEQWLRTAATNEEKILAIERMLAVMPKHKGTDGLKADLRRKLSKLRETATQKKTGKHTDIFHIPRTGAGQVQGLSVLRKCRGGEPKPSGVGQRDGEEPQPCYRPPRRSEER